MRASTMRRACFLALVCCVCASFCYPSKPLNERSTELAWQAWLLVDQSNRQGDPGLARRKITPKSVFIAPTFSPESLPPCPDGYKSDIMGRCVNIFRINKTNHLDFLLKQLNEQFTELPMETASTSGPLQFNIPLDEEVAIVVTPSGGGGRHKSTTSVKVDVKRPGGDKFDLEDVAAILRVKPESVEMTTIAELTTTMATTTMRMEEEETTTMATTTEMGETSTVPVEGDAIFFQVRI